VKYILAHDLGTSSNKAIIASEDGEIVASAAVPYGVLAPHAGWAEQDPNAWWRAVCRASREAIASAGIAPSEVAALSFAGQMQGTLPVDAKGQPLMNCLIWLDARAERQSHAATRGWIRIHGYGALRLARWLRLTNGAPTLAGKDPLAKMLWIREQRPDVWSATHKLLDAKDFLLYRSTGRFVTSYDCGNTTWLMDTRAGRMCWSPTLLGSLGIPEERLPELVPGTAIVGELQREAASAMGVRAGIPVVAGAGDVASMTVGTGCVRDHEVHLAIGTSAWIATHVPARLRDLSSYIASVCSAYPGKQLLVAHQETGGACVEWARAALGRAIAPTGNGVSYKDLDAVVERYEPGAGDLLFLPWLNGEYAPVDDPWARAGFVNLSLRHDAGHMIRALYEGVALNARWALEKVEALIGERPEALHFAGGGAASEVWCQILADVTGIAIVQFDRPQLAAARGAALIAAHALGLIPAFEDIAGLVAGRARYEPRAEHRALYDERYGLFVDFYRRNRGFFRRANAH
jgi:xylulokinase